MGLESSHEGTEQEQPRLTSSAVTDHSLAVQGDSGGEQLPANVTPASMPLDPDELVALLLSWIRTPDWSSSQAYLQAHSELLTRAAAQVLAAFAQHQPDQHVHELLMLHQQLLQIASQQGVEAAYQALLDQEEKNDSAAPEQEELQAQVIAWLQTPDWETSQTYLQTHPNLLTDVAEHMLEELKRAQEDEKAQALINLGRILLQKARIEGIEAVYERFLAPEPEAPRSDQEVTTSQDLQDPAIWNEAGIAALHQYWAGGQVADLNRAVEFWHKALNLTPSDSPDRPEYLDNLGNGLRNQYERTGELADLEAAITAFQQAVQATPSDSPDRPGSLSNLGVVLRDRYSRSGNLADLEAAITAFQQAVQATPSDSPDRPGFLSNLGLGLLDRYARTGELADLDAAIDAYQQAIQATPPDSPNRPALLSDLSIRLHDRYNRSRNLADLEAAIDAYQQAVQATPSNSPNRPGYLSNLGIWLHDRYKRSGNLVDLEAAIDAYQQAVQANITDSPNRPGWLTNLGTGLRDRSARTGELADLEAAIDAFQQAVQATPPNSPNQPALLTNLGAGLGDRYARRGELADLDAAIDAYQQAVQATPPDSPNRPALLSDLGEWLGYRYARTGEQADLDAAIDAFQQAVQATPPNSPDRPVRLSNLGKWLLDRYARIGELADLEAYIIDSRQAVQATPPDSPDWPRWLNNLGLGLGYRYARTGELADLDAIVDAFQQALQATPPNSPDWPALLSNLGNGLLDRYARTGELADLEAAIDAYQQALQATPPNSPDRPGRLNNLGNGLRDRYARTGELADLDAAITAYQQALQATPPNSPDRPGRLSNLGTGLSDRYARIVEQADLDAAIDAYQQALQATPPNSPDRPVRLNNLGAGLSYRYAGTRELADLEAAIDAYQQAVQATPPDSPDRPRWLNNLGAGLSYRYAGTGVLADLEAAIDAFQQVLQATPPDSPDRPRFLSNLGKRLRDRYARTGELADLDAAITIWEKSWSMPHPRFAALSVTYQLGQQRQGAEVADSLVTAYLEQAKRSLPRSPSVPPRALEIAEGSKSRLLTQLVGRGPLPLPLGLSPENAAREQRLLAEMTALDTQELAIQDHFASTQEETGHLQRLQQRQATLHELEDLWTGIARVVPEGTAYVALRRGDAPTWQELAHLSDTLGTATALLSFFTTTDRALLFLLRASWPAPRLVEVPLNQIDWTVLLERFIREIHYYEPGLRRSTTWDQPLSQLFTKAQPHLKGVERLILAPAGYGHVLPWGVLVERAGWHTSAGQPLPLVTLPALGILPRLRQRQHVPPGPALVVGNPRGDLPYAEIEAKEVAERFGTKPLLRATATKSAVLARFPDATLIHLATHAFFHPDNPLESGIELADGVLTAREVLQHRLQADLLVLSSCVSGQVGSLGGEELVGLSQAFLQTGVRSLLVSLWPVNDLATAALIQAFYTARQAGADKALALRQAMTHIQQDPHWTHPYYWGAFVLMGDWD